jgi:hypothetical protein
VSEGTEWNLLCHRMAHGSSGWATGRRGQCP